MPELDGFGVLREISPARIPITIFVTAHDRYAIRAFEAHTVDYLLKPFSDERFETANAAREDQSSSGREHTRSRGREIPGLEQFLQRGLRLGTGCASASQRIAEAMGSNLGRRILRRCKSFGKQHFPSSPQLAFGAGVAGSKPVATTIFHIDVFGSNSGATSTSRGTLVNDFAPGGSHVSRRARAPPRLT